MPTDERLDEIEARFERVTISESPEELSSALIEFGLEFKQQLAELLAALRSEREECERLREEAEAHSLLLFGVTHRVRDLRAYVHRRAGNSTAFRAEHHEALADLDVIAAALTPPAAGKK